MKRKSEQAIRELYANATLWRVVMSLAESTKEEEKEENEKEDKKDYSLYHPTVIVFFCTDCERIHLLPGTDTNIMYMEIIEEPYIEVAIRNLENGVACMLMACRRDKEEYQLRSVIAISQYFAREDSKK